MPTVTAMTRDGRGDTEGDRRADRLTIRPWRRTCGFESRKGTKQLFQRSSGNNG